MKAARERERWTPERMREHQASALDALLADEQLAARLRIAPELVSTSSELRTAEMTERIERALEALRARVRRRW
jgi:hypothetical protein